MFKPGSRLGNYEIVDVLGRGAAAVTYRARHVDTGSEVALKVPHKSGLTDSTFVIRFLQEGALGSTLGHKSIVRVFEAGEDGGLLYIAMELIEGTTLDERLVKEGPLPLRDALEVAREVADALAHAHSKHVVHRNLKPNHVMLLPEGDVKVMDFGVARAFGKVGLTSSDIFLGTPTYAAPESEDPRAIDHRSDLYSLGIILFEMLQGHPPFEAESLLELVRLHREREFPQLKALKRTVPEEVWKLMDRLCSKEPDDRPAAAEEAAAELDRLLQTASLEES
jgi:serine/threonine-protein kinase